MKARILLVEDEGGLRQTLAHTLEEGGYQVTQATDGKHAIGLLTATDQQNLYDVVISDIVMGDIDGVAVTRVARNCVIPPEIILLTGHGSMETAIAALRAGAFDYLLKPCRTSELIERVHAAVDYHKEYLRQAHENEVLHMMLKLIKRIPVADEGEPLSDPVKSLDFSNNCLDRYRSIGQLRIDTYHPAVYFAEERVHVTPIEYAILVRLSATPEKVVSYSELVTFTHGYTISEAEARELLGRHIRNLHRKFDSRYLLTIRGIGYTLVNPEEVANAVNA